MKIVKNPVGFYEVIPKPSRGELENFYNATPLGLSLDYKSEIDQEELYHKNIGCLESELFIPESAKSMLDIGCGEGFFLNYFDQKGLECMGIDFNANLIQSFFPHLRDRVYEGDVVSIIEGLVAQEKKYDFINATNVIEHVVDPLGVLESIKKILSPTGVLRISAPNDFSNIQVDAVSKGYGAENFWVHTPAHLNYFNTESFSHFLMSNGLRVNKLLTEFPVEFFLFNLDSNYLKNRNAGARSHRARIEIESMLARQSIEALISFREGCCKAGIGRNIIAYCSLNVTK